MPEKQAKGDFFVLVKLASAALLPGNADGFQPVQEIEEQYPDEPQHENAGKHLHIVHLRPCAENEVANPELGCIVLRKKERGKRDADADSQSRKEIGQHRRNDQITVSLPRRNAKTVHHLKVYRVNLRHAIPNREHDLKHDDEDDQYNL